MDKLSGFKDEHQEHQEHQLWAKEVKRWQYRTQKLVSLLYLLERALPEQSFDLSKHVALIDEHKQQLITYKGEMDEQRLPDCPPDKLIEQQAQFQQHIEKLHQRVEQQHSVVKQNYCAEMDEFRSLAKQLLEICY